MPVGAAPEHRASTLEGQVARVADIVAYVNHDVDDAVRAGILHERTLPERALRVLGASASERIGRMVSDVVRETLGGGTDEIRMSGEMLEATLVLRDYLFAEVYENPSAMAEFAKAEGILGGLWTRVQRAPAEFLDMRTVAAEGLDVATQDFIAGMTDRYAVGLFEQLFIPKPWVGPWPVSERFSPER